MKKKNCWKRSQSSSGFYKKSPGKMAEFIRFERNEDGSYDISKRKGLGGTKEFRDIGRKKNKTQALKFAKSYMKKHNQC